MAVAFSLHAARNAHFEPAIPGFRVLSSWSSGGMSASVFLRGDGEAIWQHDHHRLVVPLTGMDQRNVTIQTESGRTRQFQWNDSVGFYPADSKTRIITSPAKTLQVLWRRDSPCWNAVGDAARRTSDPDPLLPFRDPLIAMNGRAIAEEIEAATPDRLFIEGLATAIAVKIQRHFSSGVAVPDATGLSRQRLRRIAEYVEAHLGDNLSLDEIASVACLSPYHLSRSFKHATGTGLHRYVVLRRIAKAKELMLQTDLPLADIASAVGFETQAAFATRFRLETGLPPLRFRHRH